MHQCLSREMTPNQQDPEHGKYKGCSRDGRAVGGTMWAGKMNSKYVFQVDVYSLEKCRGLREKQAANRCFKLKTH